MTPYLWLGVLAATAFLLSWLGTGAARAVLRRIGAIDNPNHRSSHVRPTPRGGGIAPVLVTLAAWAAAETLLPGDWGVVAWDVRPVFAAALALTVLSLLDDLRGLPWALRLLAQALAVVAGLITLPGPVFQGLLPDRVDLVCTALLWLWFINLFNFMDGIDGIAGAEATTIGIGIAAVAATAGLPPILGAWGMCIAAAALGFLLWNWRPARVFLGDVGSIPWGFLLGWLLLLLAAHGHWAPAILLPLYFLADATLTLLRRLAKGAPPWAAHRTHAYQRAAAAWADHAPVVVRMLALNGALVALSLLSVAYGTAAVPVFAGLALTIGLLWYFERAAAPPGTPKGPQASQ